MVESREMRHIGIKYVFAWIDKGIIFAKQGQYQKAIECYDKAISIRSEYLETIIPERKNFVESKKGTLIHYDLSILDEEIYVDAWVNKGHALVKLERFQEAERCFKKADEILNQNL